MIIPLAPDKIEIKKSCLIINWRLLIFIFLLALLKKNWYKSACISLWKITTLTKVRIEFKKNCPLVESNQSQWLKLYVEFNTHKGMEAEKRMVKKMEGILETNKHWCVSNINQNPN